MKNEFTFDTILNWFKNLPSTLGWLAGALLVGALVLLFRHWRRSMPSSSEGVIIDNPVEPPPSRTPRRPTKVGYLWQQPTVGQPVTILTGVSGTVRGKLIEVDKALFRIGNDPDNDLVLIGDDFASGAHALLRFEAGALFVDDLDSTNGTKLNGSTFKNATRTLAPGDELVFGRNAFRALAPQTEGVS